MLQEQNASLNSKHEAVECNVASQIDYKRSTADEAKAGHETKSNEVAVEQQPSSKKLRNSAHSHGSRRKEFGDERAKVNIGSREFVRGGRGRTRGSSRGRGRSYPNDYNDYYYDDEYEDDYYPEYSRAAVKQQSADDRKKSSVPRDAGKTSQLAESTVERSNNKSEQASVLAQRKETSRGQQHGQRTRDSQKNESRNSQKKEQAPNSRNMPYSSGASQRSDQSMPGRNDQVQSEQRSESSSSRAVSDSRPSHYGRTRKAARPLSDQPRQQQQQSGLGRNAVDLDGKVIGADRTDSVIVKPKPKPEPLPQEADGAGAPAALSAAADDELSSNRPTGNCHC